MREIKKKFPHYISTWIDERELLIGDDLISKLKDSVLIQSDFVIVFFSDNSVDSKWVKKEIKWAIKKEKILGREIILPILIDDVRERIEPVEFKDRLFIKCFDHEEASIKAVAEKISTHVTKHVLRLFANVCQSGLLCDLCLRYCSNRIKSVLSDLLPVSEQKVFESLNSIKLILSNIPSYPKKDFSNIIQKCIHKVSADGVTVGYKKLTKIPYYISLADLSNENRSDDLFKTACIMASHIQDTCKKNKIIPSKIALSKTENIELNRSVALLLRYPIIYVNPISKDPKLSIEGNVYPDEEVIYLHDVAVSGDTIIKCVYELRKVGASVNILFSYIEFRKAIINLHKLISDNGLKLFPILSMDEKEISNLPINPK